MRYTFAICLLVVLGFGIGCRRSDTVGAAIDPAFRSSIPQDAKALIAVQIETLKSAALFKRHEKEFDLARFDEMSQRAGLDPRRDLSALLTIWDGKQAILLLKGSFVPSQVEQKLAAMGAQRETFQKYTLFSGHRESIVFLGRGLAVAAEAPVLREELTMRERGEGGVAAELQQRLRTLPNNYQIWAVSRGGLPLTSFPLGSDLQSALSNIVGYISGVSIAVGLDDGSHLRAEITCISNEGAQRVHDTLRGLIGLGRLTTNENELDLLRLWDSIGVDQDQQTIRIHADIAADLSDKLMVHLPGLRSRAGAVLNQR